MNAHPSDPKHIVGSGPNATHRSLPHPRNPNHPARDLHNISHQRTVLPTTNNTLLHRHRALRRPIDMVHPRPRNRRPHRKPRSQTSHHIPRNHHHPQPPGLPSRKHPQLQLIEPCGCVGVCCFTTLASRHIIVPPQGCVGLCVLTTLTLPTGRVHKHPAPHPTDNTHTPHHPNKTPYHGNRKRKERHPHTHG